MDGIFNKLAEFSATGHFFWQVIGMGDWRAWRLAQPGLQLMLESGYQVLGILVD